MTDKPKRPRPLRRTYVKAEIYTYSHETVRVANGFSTIYLSDKDADAVCDWLLKYREWRESCKSVPGE